MRVDDDDDDADDDDDDNDDNDDRKCSQSDKRKATTLHVTLPSCNALIVLDNVSLNVSSGYI